jgi:hypothetical protein
MNAKFENGMNAQQHPATYEDGFKAGKKAAIAQIEVTDDLVEVGTDALPVAVHEEFGYRQCANYMRAALTAVIAKIREGEV